METWSGNEPPPLSKTGSGGGTQVNVQDPLLQTYNDSSRSPPPTNPSANGNLGEDITTGDKRHLYDRSRNKLERETEDYGTAWNGRKPSRVSVGERKGKIAAKQEVEKISVASKRGEVMTYYDARSNAYAESEARKREFDETVHIRKVEGDLKIRAWENGDDFSLMHQEPHTQPKDPYKPPEPVVDPYASASKTDGTYMSVYEGHEYEPADYDVSEYKSVYDSNRA